MIHIIYNISHHGKRPSAHQLLLLQAPIIGRLAVPPDIYYKESLMQQLWRLTSPKICYFKVCSQGEPVVQLEGLRIRKLMVQISFQV